MRFACHATGLDAVQRLEQKKKSVVALSRGTPILAGGIGVARFLCCGFVVVFLVLMGNFKSVRFAFHAIGLDAVQCLEQKKLWAANVVVR